MGVGANCTSEWIKIGLDRGINYYVIEIGNKVIGCTALEKANSEVCYFERLAVLKEYRNRGLGRSLVDHVLAEAKSMGYKRISVGIIAAHNELKQWYCKIGFVEKNTTKFVTTQRNGKKHKKARTITIVSRTVTAQSALGSVIQVFS